jgi:hypothetical protein
LYYGQVTRWKVSWDFSARREDQKLEANKEVDIEVKAKKT